MTKNTVKKSIRFQSAFINRKLFVAVILIIVFLLIFRNDEHSNTFSCLHHNNIQKLCPIQPPNLVGPIEPDIKEEVLESIEKRFENDLQLGGYYKPKECIARDRVALVVTCRGREQQIPIFLKNLHPLMMRQQLEYQTKQWDCFIFHDIDMYPMDDRNFYDCPRINPRHMAIDVDKFNFTLLDKVYFGGVFVLTPDQYVRLNGHSNSYWGWGGEDSDLYNRATNAGYSLERYPHEVTKYKSLKYNKHVLNYGWRNEVKRGRGRFNIDGLNSIKYHVIEVEQKNSFTRILVDLVPEELGKNSSDVIEPRVK